MEADSLPHSVPIQSMEYPNIETLLRAQLPDDATLIAQYHSSHKTLVFGSIQLSDQMENFSSSCKFSRKPKRNLKLQREKNRIEQKKLKVSLIATIGDLQYGRRRRNGDSLCS